jgi:two-component system, chemotaxis family, protein-glutamate methylesterase/glutaminase
LEANALEHDPDIEVVGAAANGSIALQKIPQVNPDVVTLDIEMPEMNGLETLEAIRRTHPRLPVIMFSTLTARGAAATIEAFSRGATDYVTKPADAGNFNGAIEQVRSEIVPKVKALCGVKACSAESKRIAAQVPRPAHQRPGPVEAVVIGTSTGGPNALGAVMPHIPSDFPVPILVVQHMPPLFTRFLADRLTVQGRIPVREAAAGEHVEPSRAWLAPGDHHMSLVRDGARVRLSIDQRPPENFCRPSVDVLFRSAASIYGPGLLAVVMTGMGQDGMLGCEHVRRCGGRVFVQDELSSVVWGMPGFVARAGLADKIIPLEQIGPEIVRATAIHSAQLTEAGR